jgi:hypothetical protein
MLEPMDQDYAYINVDRESATNADSSIRATRDLVGRVVEGEK